MKQYLLLLLLTTMIFATDTVTVATVIWAPFRIGTDHSVESGIDIDILEEIGEEMNIHFEWKLYPWARCLLSMEMGKIDIMTGIAYTEERAQYITYTDNPYYACHPAFFRLQDAPFVVNSYQDLANKKIGYSRSSAYFEPFDSDTSLRKVDVHGEEQLLQMLLHQRIDLFVGTDIQVEYDIAEQQLKKEITKVQYVPNSPIRLFCGVSKKSEFSKLWSEFNKILNRMIESGKIDSIAKEYLQ